MNFEILKLSIDESIATITISRPSALNALNTRFFNEMDAMLDQLKHDTTVRALIITGEGKAFVAGADIAEMQSKNAKEGAEFSRLGQHTFASFSKMPFVVIAAINGFALGGGCELAMGCDFRIASKNAKLGQPEVNLGLIPGYAGTQRLAKLAGLGNALFLLMTADTITADEALRIGLVQKVTEPENLMMEANAIAKKIASKGMNAIRQVKQLTHAGMNMTLEDGSEMEAQVFGAMFETEETKEGIQAFLGKRIPNWNK